MLRIRLVEAKDPIEVFPDSLKLSVPDYLKHLELESFGIPDILTFVPGEHRELSKTQMLFLRRVQDVTLERLDPAEKLEIYTQDLVDLIVKESKLDDGGLRLYSRFSRLALHLRSMVYTIFSDREGKRRSGEIVWLLQHGKHRADPRYKQGDIHLVGSLIAACQANVAKHQGVLKPRVLYGIKVLGEEFFVYSVKFEEEYMRQLSEDLPIAHDLVAHKYPCTTGLRISKQEERKELLCLLYTLRECCLSDSP
jgi:hypothetical protein